MSRHAQSTGNALFGGGMFRLGMGLTPLPGHEWLAPDTDFAAELAAKHHLLATRHDEAFLALPESKPAADELLQMLAAHLPLHHPDHYARAGQRLINRVTGEAWDLLADALHPLDVAGRLVQDDLCLMQERAGEYCLIAASVCSPNRWRIAEKLGAPLAAIHAVVPGYAETLHRPVEHFFAAIKPGRILARVNWGIAEDPARFQPVGLPSGRIEAATAGEKLWLRIERQTLCRLPESAAVLFTIRTGIQRLDHAIGSPQDARDLAGTLRDMPPAMRHYKHLAHLAAPLLDWLDARSTGAEPPT